MLFSGFVLEWLRGLENSKVKIKKALKKGGKGLEVLGFISAALLRVLSWTHSPSKPQAFYSPMQCNTFSLSPSVCSTANYPKEVHPWLFALHPGQWTVSQSNLTAKAGIILHLAILPNASSTGWNAIPAVSSSFTADILVFCQWGCLPG